MENIVSEVISNSIAEKLKIEKGDVLISVNGKEIKDYIDYKYEITDEFVTMEIRKKNDRQEHYEITKSFDEDLGILFANPLMDNIKTCNNKCIFCFIDQLPPGMRKSLYIKDDDSRLSFLSGNFLTMTNMNENDIKRIIRFGISPIKISVHCTDPEIRKYMLGNKKAGELLNVLEEFKGTNVLIDCQIVLCPGINDGEILERTIRDLSAYYPNVRTVGIVPAGITGYRENLHEIRGINLKDSNNIIDFVTGQQKYFLQKNATRFVFLADEFYMTAKRKLPEYSEYEEFMQVENGIGMMRLFENDFMEALEESENISKIFTKTAVITGELSYDFMTDLVNIFKARYEGADIDVIAVKNNYFGGNVNVTGLVTGKDILKYVKKDFYIKIIVPSNMLKADEDIFLDDMSIEQLEENLKSKIYVSEVDGKAFLNNILGE